MPHITTQTTKTWTNDKRIDERGGQSKDRAALGGGGRTNGSRTTTPQTAFIDEEHTPDTKRGDRGEEGWGRGPGLEDERM